MNKNKRFDSIIFDVDGTLWDSTDVVADGWNSVFSAEPDVHTSVTGAILHAEFGRPLEVIAADLLPYLSEERRAVILRHLYRAEDEWLARYNPAPYEGVADTIRALAKDIPLYIVSNCQEGYIERFLSCTGLGEYFEDHLCPGDTGLFKADNIRTIVERHGLLRPAYVGDTEGDRSASMDAGVSFIWASYGFSEKVDADLSIRSIRELPDLLNSGTP
ncbi:MAG: HAD family hydrolase [Eubacterium sp.]|nr:HAD family hydrolase [Eubacterium sp.]